MENKIYGFSKKEQISFANEKKNENKSYTYDELEEKIKNVNDNSREISSINIFRIGGVQNKFKGNDKKTGIVTDHITSTALVKEIIRNSKIKYSFSEWLVIVARFNKCNNLQLLPKKENDIKGQIEQSLCNQTKTNQFSKDDKTIEYVSNMKIFLDNSFEFKIFFNNFKMVGEAFKNFFKNFGLEFDFSIDPTSSIIVKKCECNVCEYVINNSNNFKEKYSILIENQINSEDLFWKDCDPEEIKLLQSNNLIDARIEVFKDKSKYKSIYSQFFDKAKKYLLERVSYYKDIHNLKKTIKKVVEVLPDEFKPVLNKLLNSDTIDKNAFKSEIQRIHVSEERPLKKLKIT